MATQANKHILWTRLIGMNFLQFAVWGAYLTSQGRYLGSVGLGQSIGWFYSIQGIVSIFMPALIGIVADKWIPAQKVLSLCHFLAGIFLIALMETTAYKKAMGHYGRFDNAPKYIDPRHE